MLSNICSMKKSKNEIVDDALWIWLVQEWQKVISGPILEEKTIQLRKEFSGEEFLTSEGCL